MSRVVQINQNTLYHHLIDKQSLTYKKDQVESNSEGIVFEKNGLVFWPSYKGGDSPKYPRRPRETYYHKSKAISKTLNTMIPHWSDCMNSSH